MAEWKATPEQQAAAQDRGGALLVAAAAGSGKTKVLVDRLMGYLTAPDDPADLDEFLIHDLKMQGAAISSWGVGTNLITSKDCPSFGGVYKLAAIQNAEGEFQPKIKISENIEKITNPGNKTIYRIYDKETGMLRADLICFADETFNTEEALLLFDPNATWKKTLLPGGSYTMRELLVPIFQHGECKYESPSVKEIAEFCRQEKETLWDETKRLFNPHKVYVDLSQKLYDTKTKLLNEAHH